MVHLTSQLLKGLECEFKPQLLIEEEGGWASEQSGCFGKEKIVLPFLGPDGCTYQSPGCHSVQATYWTLFFKVISVTWIALYIM